MPTRHHGRVRGRPPRAVTMPSAAYMPATSSGEVSARTRMTWLRPARQLHRAVGVEDDLAHGRARRGGQPAGRADVAS